jgi:putative CRISPR-associated protein (TIGR02619 family)
MKIIISTVGQSVFNGDRDTKRWVTEEFARQHHNLEAIRTDPKGFPGEESHRILLDSLLNKRNNLEMIRQSSAELNSLQCLLDGQPAHEQDELHFIATDTPDGVLAARVLSDFAMDYFDRETEIHIIGGLQVTDGVAFRRQGVRGLIRTLYQLLNAHQSPEWTRILNPTGGFKGVVPYMTLVGMLNEGVEMSYIFERSDELITLADMPVDLDLKRMGIDWATLDWMNTENTVTVQRLEERLESNTPLHEHPAWGLFDEEDIDGSWQVALSGLGQLAYEQLKPELQKTPVYLSKQAAERYDKAANGSDEKRNYTKILNEIHDEENRKKKIHRNRNSSRIPAYKLGRTDERAFFLERKDHVLIVEFARHNPDGSYDCNVLKESEYDKYRLWEG